MLVYDKKIEEEFKIDGCPYNLSNNEVVSMRMVNRSATNISMKNLSCDMRKLTQLDSKYASKIDLKSPKHNTFLVYTNKILADTYKERFKNDMDRIILECWRQIFAKS